MHSQLEDKAVVQRDYGYHHPMGRGHHRVYTIKWC